MYYHGVRTEEKATSMPNVAVVSSGLQVVIGTAPVHILENPEKVTNVPVLVEDYEDAVKKIGYSNDFDKYTICQSVSANFELLQTSPIVCINVLDVIKNKKAMDEISLDTTAKKEYTFDNSDVILKSIVVKKESDVLVRGTDYLLNVGDDLRITITIINETVTGTLTITADQVSYESDDMALQVIGGYSAATGKNSGISCVNDVFPKLQQVPGQILAPGYSQKKEVAVALSVAAVNINDEFNAQALVDLDTTMVKKVEDVPGAKETLGIISSQTTILWPMVKVNGKTYAYSAYMAALCVKCDEDNDGIPSVSPSNLSMNISAMVLQDGTEVILDKKRANNYCNAIGVVTAINYAGWKSWGNNTAAYPDVTDPKDRWICVRRFMSYYRNRLLLTYAEKVDRPTDPRQVQAICDSENIWFNSLKSDYRIAGGRIEYLERDNTTEDILNGKVTFRIYLATYLPSEDIKFIVEFDPTILKEALGGE